MMDRIECYLRRARISGRCSRTYLAMTASAISGTTSQTTLSITSLDILAMTSRSAPVLATGSTDAMDGVDEVSLGAGDFSAEVARAGDFSAEDARTGAADMGLIVGVGCSGTGALKLRASTGGVAVGPIFGVAAGSIFSGGDVPSGAEVGLSCGVLACGSGVFT